MTLIATRVCVARGHLLNPKVRLEREDEAVRKTLTNALLLHSEDGAG